MRFGSAFSLVVAVAACSSAKPSSSDSPSVFVAFATDFENFRTWESFDPGIGAPGNDHVSGPRRVFVSKRPPAGAHEFPVGSMVVKESGDGDIPSRHVFAMVKRGGDFNADGAINWEWFELTNVDASRVVIAWRGVGPATGDVYGGDATGGCNLCHGSAHASDYVFAPPVFLSP